MGRNSRWLLAIIIMTLVAALSLVLLSGDTITEARNVYRVQMLQEKYQRHRHRHKTRTEPGFTRKSVCQAQDANLTSSLRKEANAERKESTNMAEDADRLGSLNTVEDHSRLDSLNLAEDTERMFSTTLAADDDRLDSSNMVEDHSRLDSLNLAEDAERMFSTTLAADTDRDYPGSLSKRIQRKVIIQTYMRSGSTLTGDILQQDPGVFYVFEPLWATQKMWQQQLDKVYYRLVSGIPLRVPATKEELEQRYMQVLGSFLHCRFQEIDLITLTHDFMHLSHSTKPFINCAVDGSDATRVHRCLHLLYTRCQTAQVIVLKVIRAALDQLMPLLAKEPGLTVIHLLRDPRGVLKSQQSLDMIQSNDITKSSRELCQLIEKDVRTSAHISKLFPGSVFTLRYEDIVSSPLKVVNRVYTFLGMHVTHQIQRYIWNITYAGHPDGCVICTVRGNASVTANRWRVSSPFSTIQSIQRQCSEVLRVLGYTSFETFAKLRDLSISAYISS